MFNKILDREDLIRSVLIPFTSGLTAILLIVITPVLVEFAEQVVGMVAIPDTYRDSVELSTQIGGIAFAGVMFVIALISFAKLIDTYQRV